VIGLEKWITHIGICTEGCRHCSITVAKTARGACPLRMRAPRHLREGGIPPPTAGGPARASRATEHHAPSFIHSSLLISFCAPRTFAHFHSRGRSRPAARRAGRAERRRPPEAPPLHPRAAGRCAQLGTPVGSPPHDRLPECAAALRAACRLRCPSARRRGRSTCPYARRRVRPAASTPAAARPRRRRRPAALRRPSPGPSPPRAPRRGWPRARARSSPG
jgi:hypothetical protein